MKGKRKPALESGRPLKLKPSGLKTEEKKIMTVFKQQKTLKQLVKIGAARDVTNCSEEQWNIIKTRCKLVAVSGEKNGINGCILTNGYEYFVIIGRFPRLYEVL